MLDTRVLGQPPKFGRHRLGRKQFVIATIKYVFDMLLQMNFHLGFGLGFATTLSSHLKLKGTSDNANKKRIQRFFVIQSVSHECLSVTIKY